MATLSLVLSVVLVILSVLLCVIILLQSKRSAGLGAIGGGSGDTYWSKNKGSSMEGALERYTNRRRSVHDSGTGNQSDWIRTNEGCRNASLFL